VLKTFNLGGVHPQENKRSANESIQYLPLPKTVSIPLGQHLGAPAEVIVSKGEKIKTGQLLAKSSGFVSANVHSSVTGIVKNVEAVFDASGYRRMSVVIDVENDEWVEGVDLSKDLLTEIKLTKEEIIAKVAETGIVGLGGATFPSHVKLSVPKGKKAECLVINGVECEPYLTSDHRLMLEYAPELIVGIQILMKALDVNIAYLGIENNKPDAISHLTELCNNTSIQVVPLKVQYPQGGEKQLLNAILKKEVPSGGLPIDIGAVVFNVGTVYAVYQAIQKNMPVIERFVTVTGDIISKPGTFLVRIGTSLDVLIEAAGGLPENTKKVVNGGPMMGKALVKTDIPVVKGSSGFLILSEKYASRFKESNCIRCARCINVCPMGLEPFLLAKLSQTKNFDTLEAQHVMDCIECGSCSYTCPANISLLDHIRLAKFHVGQIIRSRKQ